MELEVLYRAGCYKELCQLLVTSKKDEVSSFLRSLKETSDLVSIWMNAAVFCQPAGEIVEIFYQIMDIFDQRKVLDLISRALLWDKIGAKHLLSFLAKKYKEIGKEQFETSIKILVVYLFPSYIKEFRDYFYNHRRDLSKPEVKVGKAILEAIYPESIYPLKNNLDKDFPDQSICGDIKNTKHSQQWLEMESPIYVIDENGVLVKKGFILVKAVYWVKKCLVVAISNLSSLALDDARYLGLKNSILENMASTLRMEVQDWVSLDRLARKKITKLFLKIDVSEGVESFYSSEKKEGN